MVFQQMYNIADSVIAGQLISVDALRGHRRRLSGDRPVPRRCNRRFGRLLGGGFPAIWTKGYRGREKRGLYRLPLADRACAGFDRPRLSGHEASAAHHRHPDDDFPFFAAVSLCVPRRGSVRISVQHSERGIQCAWRQPHTAVFPDLLVRTQHRARPGFCPCHQKQRHVACMGDFFGAGGILHSRNHDPDAPHPASGNRRTGALF